MESGTGPVRGGHEDGPARAGRGTGHVVLYIEDQRSHVLLVERTLARLPGTRLLAASSAAAGLALARASLPDLILLDLMLPDVPGEQVLSELRAEQVTAGIPVVIVSAHAERVTIDRLLAAGAAAYFTKPLDLSYFVEVVSQLLGIAPGGARPDS